MYVVWRESRKRKQEENLVEGIWPVDGCLQNGNEDGEDEDNDESDVDGGGGWFKDDKEKYKH